MNINYIQKYLKYKKKYLSLKNKKIDKFPGGAAAAAATASGFNDQESTEGIYNFILINSRGTCWFHAILSLFINSPNTKESFDMSTSEFLEGKNIIIENLFQIIQRRFEGKIRRSFQLGEENKFKYLIYSQIPQIADIILGVIQRYLNIKFNSSSIAIRNDLSCENLIEDSFREIFPSKSRGGSMTDSYKISNIISIGILNKFTNFLVRKPSLLNREDFLNFFPDNDNKVGYTIDIPGHVLCIYQNISNVFIYINNEIMQHLHCFIILNERVSVKFRHINNFKELLKTLAVANSKNWRTKLVLIEHNITLEINVNVDNFGGAGAWSKGSSIKFTGAAKKEIDEEKSMEQRRALQAFTNSSSHDYDVLPNYKSYTLLDRHYFPNRINDKLKETSILKQGYIRAISVLKLSDTTIDIMDNVRK